MEELEISTKSSNFYKYLTILREIGEITDNVLITGLIYLDKIIANDTAFKLVKPDGIQVLCGICVLTAYKFLIEEEYWPLHEYCKLVGISCRSLMKYEIFVASKLLMFDFYVSESLYRSTKRALEKLAGNIYEDTHNAKKTFYLD